MMPIKLFWDSIRRSTKALFLQSLRTNEQNQKTNGNNRSRAVAFENVIISERIQGRDNTAIYPALRVSARLRLLDVPFLSATNIVNIFIVFPSAASAVENKVKYST